MADLGSRAMSKVIEGLATVRFAESMLGFVNEAAGADHCVVYRFADGCAQVLGAASLDGSNLARRNAFRYVGEGFWLRDPFVGARGVGAAASTLSRVEPVDIPDLELREEFYLRPGMREKVFITGARAGAWYGLSVFRSRRTARFSGADIGRLAQAADMLVSCSARHDQLACGQRDAASELASIDRIEERLRAWRPNLTGREVEVCARILHGHTIEGIALELGIGAESVATYRKRSFRRLRVGTRHDLLTAFLRSL